MADHNSEADAKTATAAKDTKSKTVEKVPGPAVTRKPKKKTLKPEQDKHAGEGGTYRITESGERVKVRRG